MVNWFKGKPSSPVVGAGMYRAFCDSGLVLAKLAESLPKDSSGLNNLDRAGLEDLLVQLEDDGLAATQDDITLVPWDHVFQIIENPDYSGSRELLGLPQNGDYVPKLISYHTLTDQDFSISIVDWHDQNGRLIRNHKLFGAAIQVDSKWTLLSRPAWETHAEVLRFQRRPQVGRDSNSQRRDWGRIRRLAMAARASLDGFLLRSVVLTPEKLDIGLRSSNAGGTRVVEIIPSFEGAPPNWLEKFDTQTTIPDVYNFPTPEGIVQVVISTDVKTVLASIKRLDGRRVAGVRAEAFLINPYAALGEAASNTIDEKQFMAARAHAGLLFEQFTAYVEPDATGYPIVVGLNIGAAQTANEIRCEFRPFTGDSELANFIQQIEAALTDNRQLCAWEGYDFEILGDTSQELNTLRDALEARGKPRVLVSYANIYDLSLYASRVDDIGVEKDFYSPYIAKKTEGDGWFPENIIPVISWVPDGSTEPVAVPVTLEARQQFRAKLHEAEANNQDSFVLKGFDKPIPVREAKFILETFDKVDTDAKAGNFDPLRPKNQTARTLSRHLVIKANIQSIDYEEARRDILRSTNDTPLLPSGLLHTVTLKHHQLSGVAWLQHLFKHAPHHCRGGVLADDMGLGKTLQLLTLLAWAFETDPSLPPAMIVAPVSLLENWAEESNKFLKHGTLSVLTAYGDNLTQLRVPRESVDAQLRSEGLIKFLRPGWRGASNVVLTTYETLRDLEFSFAAEKWSVMICDEAQRIKNPNAMVTRAAKKQNVIFRIACTGTPVENTLVDLWCLFDYVQPGLLGALNDFGRRYRRPIEAETEEEQARVAELREKISPQILRRTKAEVARDLPPKVDVKSLVILSSDQRALYASAVNSFRNRDNPDAISPFKNHLGLLHYLRLICTDPRPIGLGVFRPEPLARYRERAPKLAWLLATLRDIQIAGEKVIVFCEFREIQRMLRHYIEEVFGFAPDVINGDTSAIGKNADSRQKRIKAFQTKPGFGVIILSPVAVGFGVNIQEANHVVHYTRTWNPAKEDQATDRAYRIGQTRPVKVYCPIVSADDFTTFDVKMDQLLTAKRALAGDMLNGSGEIGPAEFSIDEVAPDFDGKPFSKRITLDDALRMDWAYFECLVAAIWQKRGYRKVLVTPPQDAGVDVVAITEDVGVLIQCKSGGSNEISLGWDAIKEVVAGEAAYRLQYTGVSFKKICVTSQSFNSNAVLRAAENHVELVTQIALAQLLEEFPVFMSDVERLRYPSW